MQEPVERVGAEQAVAGVEKGGVELPVAEQTGAERLVAERTGAERPVAERTGAERAGAERSGAEFGMSAPVVEAPLVQANSVVDRLASDLLEHFADKQYEILNPLVLMVGLAVGRVVYLVHFAVGKWVVRVHSLAQFVRESFV